MNLHEITMEGWQYWRAQNLSITCRSAQCKQSDAIFTEITVYHVCQINNEVLEFVFNMGRKCSLTDFEKGIITFEWAKGKTTLEIAKMIGRYHRKIQNFANDPMKVC